jgi:hypothetical protein
MSKLLDTIDELNKGQNFIKAASMAIRGGEMESDEVNAMDRLLGEAQ